MSSPAISVAAPQQQETSHNNCDFISVQQGPEDTFLSRSAGTNRLAVPPVKVTAIANQPGFPGCRPTNMERSARRRDFSRIVIHLPPAT